MAVAVEVEAAGQITQAGRGEQIKFEPMGEQVVDRWLDGKVIDDEFRLALVDRVGEGLKDDDELPVQAQLWMRRDELEVEFNQETNQGSAVNQRLKAIQAATNDLDRLKDPKHRFDLPKMRREYGLYEAAALWAYVATEAVLGRGMELLPARGGDKRNIELEQEKNRLKSDLQGWTGKMKTLVEALGQAEEFRQWLWPEIEQVAVQDRGWAEIYGLKLAPPERLPGFLDEYSRRVRSEPGEGEIRRHLNWAVEEAYRQRRETDLAEVLPVPEDLALNLVASYTGDADVFGANLEQVAEEILNQWETHSHGAKEWRDNCVRFCRRRLVAVWEQGGNYHRRSLLPLELPVKDLLIRDEGNEETSSREERGQLLKIRFPNGKLVSVSDMTEGKVGMIDVGMKRLTGDVAQAIWDKLLAHFQENGVRAKFMHDDKLNPDAPLPNGANYRFDVGKWRVFYDVDEGVINIIGVARRAEHTYSSSRASIKLDW